MTPERARYILANQLAYGALRWSFPSPLARPPYYTGELNNLPICEDGITPAEWEFAKMMWDFSPPQHSFYDVIQAISRG